MMFIIPYFEIKVNIKRKTAQLGNPGRAVRAADEWHWTFGWLAFGLLHSLGAKSPQATHTSRIVGGFRLGAVKAAAVRQTRRP